MESLMEMKVTVPKQDVFFFFKQPEGEKTERRTRETDHQGARLDDTDADSTPTVQSERWLFSGFPT